MEGTFAETVSKLKKSKEPLPFSFFQSCYCDSFMLRIQEGGKLALPQEPRSWATFCSISTLHLHALYSGRREAGTTAGAALLGNLLLHIFFNSFMFCIQEGGKLALPQEPRCRATFPRHALHKRIKAEYSYQMSLEPF